MNIIISNNRDNPIYEQITEQIKRMIINGELKSGDSLPSMRQLAKSIRVSVITVQRAYEDLQRDGFITTEIGRGSFVLEKNKEFFREEKQKEIEAHIQQATEIARKYGISLKEILDLVKIFYEED